MKDIDPTTELAKDTPPPVESGAREAPPPPTAEERIAVLEKEKRETYDRLLRSAADFDNFRKRARRDIEEAVFKSREEVLREMLLIIDNLERALAAARTANASGDGVVEGIGMVLRQFEAALDRFGVKSFTSVGESFDPSRHEAIAQIATGESAPGTVVLEMQKGYMMGMRLLRPAMVGVAKPAAPTEEASQSNGTSESTSRELSGE